MGPGSSRSGAELHHIHIVHRSTAGQCHQGQAGQQDDPDSVHPDIYITDFPESSGNKDQPILPCSNSDSHGYICGNAYLP